MIKGQDDLSSRQGKISMYQSPPLHIPILLFLPLGQLLNVQGLPLHVSDFLHQAWRDQQVSIHDRDEGGPGLEPCIVPQLVHRVPGRIINAVKIFRQVIDLDGKGSKNDRQINPGQLAPYQIFASLSSNVSRTSIRSSLH